MRQLEDFMNGLTDMDWGWWPVVSLRPPKDKDIDNKVLFQISLVFGSVLGLILFFLREVRHRTPFSATSLVLYLLLGVIAFFIFYKVTFACFWNRRARRLRSPQTKNEPVV